MDDEATKFELIDDHYSAPIPTESTDNRSQAISNVLSNLREVSLDDLEEINKCISLINRRKWMKKNAFTSSVYSAYSYSLRIHIIYRLFALIKYRTISAITLNAIALISSLL